MSDISPASPGSGKSLITPWGGLMENQSGMTGCGQGGILAAIQDPALIVDTCGAIQQVNQAACDWVQEVEFRLLGGSVHSLFHDPRKKPADCDVCQAAKNHVICPDRTVQVTGCRWITLSSAPLDVANPQLGSLQIIRDVTDRKNWQQALQQKAERFELGLSCSNEALWDYNFRTGDAYLSPHFCYRFNIDESQLADFQSSWLSRIYEPDRDKAQQVLKDCLSGSREKFKLELRFRDRNEQVIWVMANGRLIGDETERAPDRLIVVLADITRQKVLDSALRQSEQRFRGVFESAGHGMAIVALDGSIRKSNTALCKMLGYSKINMHQMHYDALVTPEDLQAQQKLFQELLAKKLKHYCGERYYQCVDGREVSAILSLTLVADKHAHPIHFVAQLMDITDYKYSLNKLKQREFEFSKAQSIAKIGCWTCRLSTNEFEMDQMGRDLVGERNLPLCRDLDTFIKYLHPTDKNWFIEAFEDAINRGSAIEGEFRVQFPHQEPMYIQTRGELIFNSALQPESISGIFQDVTEFRKNSARIEKHNLEMASAEQIARFGIWEWHVASDDLHCSHSLCDLLGLEYSSGPRLFQELVNLVHPEDIHALMNELDAALVGKNKLDLPCRVYRANNDICYGRIVASVSRDEVGAPETVRGIFQDITEQQLELEERERMQYQLRQSQRMDALGQLTGGIAHDFSNILGSMLGYVEMARDRFSFADSSEILEYLGEIDTAGRRARDLISQMLVFSRGGSVAPKPMVVGPLVDKVVRMVRSMMPSDIQLTTKIDSTLPVMMMDSVQLHQLVMNLCINARDALSQKNQGSISIKVYAETVPNLSCASCHQPLVGEYVVIAVADNGSGIEQRIAENIFDPFFSTKPTSAGTGMGLSVVHGIVHEHNGHIIVDSSPGVGTEIKLYFPAINMHHELEVEPGRGAAMNRKGTRLMLVEDDDTLLRCLSGFLMSRGFDVWSFQDPVEALQVFRHDPARISLLITDMYMPGLMGDELAKAMLKVKPDLPVVLTTGFVHLIDAKNARELGILGFLTKPVDPDELVNLISGLLPHAGKKIDAS